MYEEFYGFREKPFSLNPDPNYLFKSRKHTKGLTMLEYGLASEASIVILTGEVGSGKTTLTRKLLQRISHDLTMGVMTHTSRVTDNIFPWICHAFGLEHQGKDTVTLFEGLNNFLRAEHKANRRVALIVDEAQNLSIDDLDEIRMLSNINVDDNLFMQLVLVGQPELLEKLRLPELRQLAQRISVDYNLEALSGPETALYIRHRIKVAGGTTDLFNDRCCTLVHRESRGIPRLINIICDAALVYAFAGGGRDIDEVLLKTVIHDRVLGGILPIRKAAPKKSNGSSPRTEAASASGPTTLTLSELPTRLTRAQAVEYLGRRHGIPIKENTLYHRHMEDTGPPIVYFGRKPLYPVAGLDEWAEAAVSDQPSGAKDADTAPPPIAEAS